MMFARNKSQAQSLLFNATRSLIQSTRKSFPPQNALLHEFLLPSHDKFAEHTAMVDYATGKSLTHGQIGEIVGKIANRLRDAGVKPGDHVGVSSFNHIAYFPLSLGIMAAGAKAAFCNPGYVERELEQLYRTGDVSRVIGHPKNASVVSNACKNLGLPEPLDIDKILEESAPYSSQHPYVEMFPHDTCSLFYSSGTTGFPKAVEITHDNFVSQCKILEDPEAFNFSTETVNNGFLPSFHVFGSVVGMHVLTNGAKAIILDGFTPESFLGANQTYNVTFITVVPPIMVFLAKHPIVDQYDQSSLRDLVCAAAPCSKQLEDDVKSRLNNPQLLFRQGYGLSETTAASHFVKRGTEKQGSIGSIANNTECKVIDITSGKECGPHERGEIYIKGPCVMKGYYNNPKATKETMSEDGFLKTGDIGYYDEDGDFYIVDRVKEFIKVKGFQVAPAELEALLLEHPKIADAAVIGIPHEKFGESPKAFVVKHPNVDLDGDDVKAFVRENAIDYKVPKEVEFISVVPRLPSGKIQRKLLRDAEKEKRES